MLLRHEFILHLIHAVDAFFHGMIVLFDIFLAIMFKHVFLPFLLEVRVGCRRLIVDQLLHGFDFGEVLFVSLLVPFLGEILV